MNLVRLSIGDWLPVAFSATFLAGILSVLIFIRGEIHEQTVALQTIAAELKPPVQTDLVSIDPRVLALMGDAGKKKGAK